MKIKIKNRFTNKVRYEFNSKADLIDYVNYNVIDKYMLGIPYAKKYMSIYTIMEKYLCDYEIEKEED